MRNLHGTSSFTALVEICTAKAIKIAVIFYGDSRKALVDARMLVKMLGLASGNRTISRTFDQVSAQPENIARTGNKVVLHKHPHWHERRRTDNGCDVPGTRYKLSQSSDWESESMMKDYHHVHADTCDLTPVSYRAGRFSTDTSSANVG